MNIGIACGGTGGHVIPGLATAKELKSRGHNVVLWLAGRDVEDLSVEQWDGEVVRIQASGFPSGFSIRSIKAAISLIKAYFDCRKRIKQSRPDVMLAMGSYASVGPVMAASAMKVPVVLHEANAVPGRAIAFLERYADVIALCFEESARFFEKAKTEVTGLPTRASFDSKFDDGCLDPDLFTLLVMGGSQGAHFLNTVSLDAVRILHEKGVGLQVVHLTGAKDEEFVRQGYDEIGIRNVVYSYLQEMGKAYNAADIAVSRAGAASCVELSVCKLPAILVPLPTARRNHQMLNALAMQKATDVEIREENTLTAENMACLIQSYISDPGKISRIKDRLAKFAKTDATERLADLVIAVQADSQKS